MAATLVGGAFLSASVQTMMDKLTSTEFRDYLNNKKMKVSLLRQLQTTLLTLQAVLDDAEEKQISNPAVKKWLEELKDAVFDAEDLLDQISYDSLRCKVENSEAENITNQVWNFLSSPFNTFYGEINSQMKNMCERLQLFAQHKDICGLQTKSGRVTHRTPSSSVVNESVMVGRKDDKEKLVNMLLSDSDTYNNDVGVVAIFGMGGVGKTTLAQVLYNDKEIEEHFHLKAWACVSEDFDIMRVTKTLLESVTSRAWESNNLDFLRVELKENLRDKRFLFVLDDLWNDNYNDRDELVTPLINGKTRSRVIITTRQQKVAEVAHTFPIHKLEPLSDEDCWSLLSKHAFGSEDLCGGKYPNLEAIGRKIARKCGGLPIAAKTLGGLLRSKDYALDRKQLVLLWMAEGFLEHSQSNKALEEVGDDCFVELLSRSLIQQSNDDFGRHKLVMHDLVNDLATTISGKSCYRLECGDKIPENVRHLSYNQEMYDIFMKFETFYDFKCLRSFIPFHQYWLGCFLSSKVVDDLLPTLSRLRVLSLSKYGNITMLPDSFGGLVQLRYLDLSYTKIKSLPNTICNLYNLQTLILQSCWELTELPVNIGRLINLRHLDISGTFIMEMPMQIVGLENLLTLTIFAVGKQETGLSVRELRKFPKLQGKLYINNLHNVIDAMEAYDANLKSKEKIEELMLQWNKQSGDSRMVKDVLDMLKPSVYLKKLIIELYGGTSFSSWLGDSSFSNMISLSIRACEYCIELPPLGQLPSLKELRIEGMSILDTIGPEFYGMVEGGSNSSFQPFPSLHKLEFENMPSWKEWLPFEGGKFPFPCLKTLLLDQCLELRGHLPSHLSSIQEVRIFGCDHLLATPPTLWLSSIKNISIESTIGLLERTRWSLLGNDSPSLLEHVSISSCDTLLSVPKMILSSASLKKLNLYCIPSLTAFPVDGLPTSLQSLRIVGCENLAFMPLEIWSKYTSLVTLELENCCDALTSFPLDGFPVLQDLSIDNCNALTSFPLDGSSHHPSTLQSLYVASCKAFRSLPQRMDTLTTLEELILIDLPELILSFGEGVFLPPNLRSIFIEPVTIATTPVTEWGLQRLTALSKMRIGDNEDIVYSLLKERLLPTSLVSLEIYNLSEMKSFDGNGLRHLSSLQKLEFVNCSMLESLCKDMLPSSLETLIFNNCPRFESFPDRLPSSIKMLKVKQCPLLQAMYESERREHRSNIAHIPVIEINGEVTI